MGPTTQVAGGGEGAATCGEGTEEHSGSRILRVEPVLSAVAQAQQATPIPEPPEEDGERHGPRIEQKEGVGRAEADREEARAGKKEEGISYLVAWLEGRPRAGRCTGALARGPRAAKVPGTWRRQEHNTKLLSTNCPDFQVLA